ncbi:hypothetical protein VHEMI04723 [[Torrubiella] hemipterigena]|uniref:Cytidyltransferase-like domain-containing protein n=1 Tax=[Torrubiella] hemipterigena TaxID=1531966 RepID=A0A0A1T209_9HYPO|nr:hypothetical protein VHEMI04723 [[Torrubiella] hemipterigena]
MPETPPSLLLLPAPPSPATFSALQTAYQPPLTSVLGKLHAQSLETSSTANLTIAVAYSALAGNKYARKRHVRWQSAQSLLAGLYSLVSAICAEKGILSYTDAGAGGVDVRIVIVDHEKGTKYEKGFDGKYPTNSTCVQSLATYASTVYPWGNIYHPSCEASYALLSHFLAIAETRQTIKQSQIIAVEGGLHLSTETASASDDISSLPGDYGVVCLGGTFDHLHPGHKLLLHAVALLLQIPEAGKSPEPSVIVIGISVDDLLKKKKYAEQLESWDVRALNVLRFLATVLGSSPTTATITTTKKDISSAELHASFRDGTVLVRCVELQDPFGPTTEEESIEAIVVSGETRSGGSAINDRRTAKDWASLAVYEIDVLDASGTVDGDTRATDNFASKLSSTAIRQRIFESNQNK